MTSPSDTMHDAGLPAEAAAPATFGHSRPFLWSVRRELWENRSIWIAPLVAAGVVLIGFVMALAHLPSHVPLVEMGHGVRRAVPPVAPYVFGAGVIFFTSLVVSFFYSLGALNGERRDRTILFWKSLPVSDLTTVLSKAIVPLVVVPVVTFVITVAAEIIILALSAADSANPNAAIWTRVDFLSMAGGLAYFLVTSALWYAPIWGWALMIGGWARRVSFLWAAGLPLGICVIERIAFGTSYAWRLLNQRLFGAIAAAFSLPAPHEMALPQIDIAGFVSSPGLWIGLVLGAAFIAAAVWLRRYRDPV